MGRRERTLEIHSVMVARHENMQVRVRLPVNYCRVIKYQYRPGGVTFDREPNSDIWDDIHTRLHDGEIMALREFNEPPQRERPDHF